MRSVTHSLSESYEAKPDAVPAARGAVAAFAADAGVADAQLESVRLAVSEAVTNAVVHAYAGGPGEIRVTATLVSGELWLRIADDGRGLRPRADRSGLGLGLALIAQVSDQMAIVSGAGGGTEVRIRFDVASDGGEGGAAAGPTIARGVGAMAVALSPPRV